MSERLVNQEVKDYIRSLKKQNWYGYSMDDVQKIANTLNYIAARSQTKIPHEHYYVHQSKRDSLYIYIKCAQKRCRFSIWFDRNNSGLITFNRATC